MSSHLLAKVHSASNPVFEGVPSDLQTTLYLVWSQNLKILIFGMLYCCLETKGQKSSSWKPSSCWARSNRKPESGYPFDKQNHITTLKSDSVKFLIFVSQGCYFCKLFSLTVHSLHSSVSILFFFQATPLSQECQLPFICSSDLRADRTTSALGVQSSAFSHWQSSWINKQALATQVIFFYLFH